MNCSEELKKYLKEIGKWTPNAFASFGAKFDSMRITIPTKEGSAKKYNLAKKKDEDGYTSIDGSTALIGDLGHDEVILCEGEWDAFILYELGFRNVITSIGGASTFKEEWAEELAGKKILIVYDNDDAGRKGAINAAKRLHASDCEVWIITLPIEVGEAGDVRDYFQKLGKSADDFRNLTCASARRFEPPISKYRSSLEYPVLGEGALYGLSGKITKALLPHTEASKANILGHLLTFFGNVVGRSSYTYSGNRKVHANLYAAIVGNTSKARKGTGFTLIKNYFAQVIAPEWVKENILPGLASGEGLIYYVRDAREDLLRKIDDPGVEDKRLLVIEEELDNLLSKMKDVKSILSPTLRGLWDSGCYAQPTKGNPASTTDAHVSIIGHITEQELVSSFRDVDASNGFGNRFLWFAVKRAQKKPITKSIGELTFVAECEELKLAVQFATTQSEVPLSDPATEMYAELYDQLSEVPAGYLGSMSSRSECHILKLALIYALLDRSNRIEVHHVEAAVAIVKFSIDSCNYLFQHRRFGKVETKILQSLEAHGRPVRRTTLLKNTLGGNLPAEELSKARDFLLGEGLIETFTDGRIEYWSLCYEMTKVVPDSSRLHSEPTLSPAQLFENQTKRHGRSLPQKEALNGNY